MLEHPLYGVLMVLLLLAVVVVVRVVLAALVVGWYSSTYLAQDRTPV